MSSVILGSSACAVVCVRPSRPRQRTARQRSRPFVCVEVRGINNILSGGSAVGVGPMAGFCVVFCIRRVLTGWGAAGDFCVANQA
jgi:hypothetical protein